MTNLVELFQLLLHLALCCCVWALGLLYEISTKLVN
jgi:hypothetical protein